MAKSKQFIEGLEDKAWEYIQECMENKTESVSAGRKVLRLDRHIPTIDYFLRIWLPMNWDEEKDGVLQGETIQRRTWYRWLDAKGEDGNPNDKCLTIKSIDGIFKALAADIVANEGKGIFYAKNRLGMTDRAQVDTTANVSFLSVDPIKPDDNDS